MLNILTAENLQNVLVVVTRYFGGILLGTGGLLRAYTTGTKEALAKAEIINKAAGIVAYVDVAYNDVDKLDYYLKNNDIFVVDSKFELVVRKYIETTKEKYESMISQKSKLNFEIITSHIERECFVRVNNA